jgi:molybdopterin-guanine dinucleotide biosynthesis protein B
MSVKVLILGVVGHRKSGKTTVIESIVQELTKRGYRVATAKHTGQKGFSVDAKGKDTWRHSMAGANPVVCVSDVETAILIKDGEANFSLDQLFKFMPEIDVMVLEGFSKLVLNNEGIGKILCVRDREEYKEFREKARGEIIISCSTQSLGGPILSIKEDSQILVEQALKYIERKREILRILSLLPGIDCEECGRSSCKELALDIYEGKAKLSDCIILKLKPKLKTRITINDAEVPLNPFVSEIIRKSILGMASSLKGVSISGNEEVRVKILS